MKLCRNPFVVAVVLACSSVFAADVPSFPGAEGFGALATGGRGGEVYHVTNLNDEGPGSFRDGISQGHRTVVFDVAGVVKIKKQLIGSSDLTIAGESAPGQGVTIYGNGISFSRQHNVIVRYVRFRGSIEMSRGDKTFNIGSGENIIVDHCTVSWGRWDNMGVTRAGKDESIPPSHNVTIQDCLVSEAIDPQRFGCLIDIAHQITVARNLWVDHQSRNPKGEGDLQYVNNVVYNFGHGGYVGSHSTGGVWKQDLINNYFIAGPSTVHDGHNFLGEFTGAGAKVDDESKRRGDIVYQTGNMVDLDRDGKLNGREVTDADLAGVELSEKLPSKGPLLVRKEQNPAKVAVTVMSAVEAFDHVTKHAGASLHRDSIDERIVGDVLSLGTKGAIIKSEAEAGGINEIPAATAPKDSDGDGIPDDYEAAHGLNPNDPKDGAAITPSGYSNLELYLHSLVKN